MSIYDIGVANGLEPSAEADAISSTLLWHREPVNAAEAVAITHIVSVADDLVTMKGMGLLVGALDRLPSTVSVNALGVSDEQMVKAWAETETGLQDILDHC